MRRRKSGRAGFTLIEIMIVVGLIGLLAGIGIPNYLRTRDRTLFGSIGNNLRLIEEAKEQWGIENRAVLETPVTYDQLVPWFRNSQPLRPVVEEVYSVVPEKVAGAARATLKAPLLEYTGFLTVTNFVQP
jgi:prepilin-type N-terminal cleavage/methylation domain-containing protein